MKTARTLIAGIALAVSVLTASAAEYTKGVIKKVDLEGKKVTVIHEELKSLEMPAMTMVFRTADDAMLEQFKEGQAIEFTADRVNGKLTITAVK
jgi:Cu/Ag efflux protein CusF